MYSYEIYRVVYCYCKNIADSKDIVQNTILKLYISKNDFKDKKHIKNWLYKVVINETINVRKSRWSNYKEIPKDYEMKTKEQKEICEVILKLPDKYRILIILYYYVRYSIDEISSIIKKEEYYSDTITKGEGKIRKYMEEYR